MAATRTQTVPALDRALSILELLSQSRSGLSLPEIVQQSKLPRSTVHYLVVTLERRGYLQRNERTSRYLFGLNLVRLAHSAVGALNLRQQAAPHLQALMQRTQLTVHLAVLSDNEVVLVAKHDLAQGSRMASWIGKRMDVHCTALGKVLLAHMPEAEVERTLREHGLPRHNDNTIASPRKLREELAKVVRLGYAVDDEEDELGSRCIGAPVREVSGKVIAALSVAGTCAEINAGNIDQLVPSTIRAAAQLSAALAELNLTAPVPQAS